MQPIDPTVPTNMANFKVKVKEWAKVKDLFRTVLVAMLALQR
jgi:hypothetical protein